MSEAVSDLLKQWYPVVTRVARALSGSDALGGKIAGNVLKQSLQVMSIMRPGELPDYWFYHHTVLEFRAHQAEATAAALDPLAASVTAPEPAYLAFVRAIRTLPFQQREAFILHHGERLNTRLLGVAMDCSTVAAENHLNAANLAVKAVAGEKYEQMLPVLTTAFNALTPTDNKYSTAAAPVSRAVAAHRLRGAARPVLMALILAGVAVSGWHWRTQVVRGVQIIRSLDKPASTQPAVVV